MGVFTSRNLTIPDWFVKHEEFVKRLRDKNEVSNEKFDRNIHISIPIKKLSRKRTMLTVKLTFGLNWYSSRSIEYFPRLSWKFPWYPCVIIDVPYSIKFNPISKDLFGRKLILMKLCLMK